MRVIQTDIPDLMILEPKIFEDDRGYFFECFNQGMFASLTGSSLQFVQDNHSHSRRNVLRGLHYQIQQPQGKLVRVTSGEVFDVAVDIRRSSATFLQWVGVVLSDKNRRQLWIPPGFAHGFLVLSETADFLYKATDYYAPKFERCVIWNDPSLAIKWPDTGDIQISSKDTLGVSIRKAELFQ